MKLEPGMAYNTKTLNKVFAFLSILFMISVVWIALDDFIRPWKAFQLKGNQIKAQKIEAEIKELEKGLDQKKLKDVSGEIEAGKKIVKKRESKIKALEERLASHGALIYAENMKKGEYNSFVAETAFKWEVAADHGDPNAPRLKKKLDNYKALFADSSDRLKKLQSDEKAMKIQLNNLKKELLEANRKMKQLVGTKERLEAALKKVRPETLQGQLIMVARNMPGIDYLDPTLKIQQVVLENITDDRYFQHVPKVDRCMTCHVFIDQAGYEKQENPYRTHPNLDLMVGTNSIHPMNSYGCTTCHGGEGHRVNDFNAAAHTPSNEFEEAQWREKYNWHPPHKIQAPMLKTEYTEASCFKCHSNVQRIGMAKKHNRGRELLEIYGCYGCHKIKSFEGYPKPGPALNKVASKIDKNFFKNWVWAPDQFNPKTKMPSFFNQSNNSRPDFMAKNVAEVNAIAEFVYDKSSPYHPQYKYKGGNIEKGKQLISEVGCLGCHQVQGLDAPYDKTRARRGPYLNGLGSKVSGNWLVSWLISPSHYQPDTIMPSFRLTKEEASNIAAFLLDQKRPKFAEKKFDPLDKKLRDELLIEYFAAFDTLASAEKKLAKMSDRERTLELGKRSVGKYGCYSCHQIDGFEGRAPIGPELSGIGSKPLTQFGFGHEKIPHERDAWISAHLENPRRWDRGVSKPFKDLVRMPRFTSMTGEEIEKMTTVLLGFVTDKIPASGVKTLSSREAIMEEGKRIVRAKNCTGCHRIDGVGGEILPVYADDYNEGPPWLVEEGDRVRPKWLYHFLSNVNTIRPHLTVRMPSFTWTNEELNKVVEYFRVATEALPHLAESGKVYWKPGEKEAAHKLFEEFACTSCHTQGFVPDEEASAPNLHQAYNRLRPDWIKKWLSNPQAILPYTPMPNFWEGGESQAPDILGGDQKKQIEALLKYIHELGLKNQNGPKSKKHPPLSLN